MRRASLGDRAGAPSAPSEGASRRHMLISFGAVVAGSLVLAGSSASAPTVDQQQNLMDTTTALAVGGDSDQKLAQVVTSGMAGLLTEVRVPIACDGAASLTLTINDASQKPEQDSFAVSTFPGSIFPPGDPSHLQSLPLAAPLFLPAETAFAVILSASGSCGLTPGPVGESYKPGKAYFDARPNPPGVWVCMCEFPNSADDLAFQTFVDPVCLVPNILGLTRVAAELYLRRYGCAVGRVTTRYAWRCPPGGCSTSIRRPMRSLPAGARLISS